MFIYKENVYKNKKVRFLKEREIMAVLKGDFYILRVLE